MVANQKIKSKDWYLNIDPPIKIAADFECMSVPVQPNNDSFMDKLFVNKPTKIGYKTAKNPDYANVKLEKERYNFNFPECCFA